MNAIAAWAIAQARFKVGDVVVTEAKVSCINSQGKKEGYADAGWKWRVTDQVLTWRGLNCTVSYKVTAHDAPGVYFQVLRDKQIRHKVDFHAGGKYEKKEKVSAAAS